MTSADLIFLGLMVLSALFSFLRGFVREVLSLVAWGGATVAAVTYAPTARPTVAQWVPSPDWAEPAAYILVFVVSLILLSLIAKVVGGAVRSSAIGGVDRSLGMLFGLARGAGLAIVAYIVAGMAVPIDHWPAQVLESRALPFIYDGAVWVVRWVERSTHLSAGDRNASAWLIPSRATTTTGFMRNAGSSVSGTFPTPRP